LADTLTQIGKYRIERELGRGAMGVVYKAFDPVVERRVAIKTIRLDVEDSADLLNRLKREAKSVGQLEHPNIVTLYEAGESGGLFYLAMQFIEGETLQDRLARQRWFTLKETLELFAQICSGLDYAHSHGVIHRDIKPANIMITTGGVVKLTDFGIAKFTGGGGTSTSGLIVGTPSYMSPEQAVGKPLDGRSDIFSLGSILYELLTGERAFPGQNVTTVMYKIVHESPTPVVALQPGLDAAVEPIVLKALAKNPDARFQSCQEIALALQDYVNHSVAAASHISATFRSPEPIPAPVSVPAPAPGVSGSVPGARVAPEPVPAADSGVVATSTTGQTGMSLAWLAIGALGALLAVVVVLLVMQMHKPPATNVATRQTPPGSSGTATPANPPAGSTSAPATSKPEEKPPAQTEPPKGQTKETAGSSTPRKPKEPPARHTEVTPPVTIPPVIKPPASQQPAAQNQNAVQQPQPAQPETFSSLLLKGDLAYQQSKYEDALAAYKKAYLLDTRNAEVKRKIRVVLTLLGRPQEASRFQ
jgi:eukaryotic-like serine/threonine-protein kinase